MLRPFKDIAADVIASAKAVGRLESTVTPSPAVTEAHRAARAQTEERLGLRILDDFPERREGERK